MLEWLKEKLSAAGAFTIPAVLALAAAVGATLMESQLLSDPQWRKVLSDEPANVWTHSLTVERLGTWSMALYFAEVFVSAYLAVGVLSFLRRVWDELESDLVKGTAARMRAFPGAVVDVFRRWISWQQAAFARWSPGYRGRYLREMAREYGLFNDRGLGLINTNRLDLEKVYVELRATADAASRSQRLVANELRPEQLREGAHPVWRFLRDMQRSELPFALVIVGPPGSGKTTLMRHVLLTLARNRQRRFRLNARLPVLLELRRVHQEIVRLKKQKKEQKSNTSEDVSLEEILELHFADSKIYPGLKGEIPHGWFARELQRGGCLILLDGLDEVANDKHRQELSAWVDYQLRRDIGRKNLFVVTSQPQGYEAAPLDRAWRVDVQPFVFSQVTKFVKAWYLASEFATSSSDDLIAVQRRAEKESSDLLERLMETPALYDLTSNPLLLTMISMVHRYIPGPLPENRVELYESVCKALLESWRQSRGHKDDLTGDQKLTVLRPLARRMMDAQVREISESDALTAITPALELIGVKPNRHAGFLRELQAGSGLVFEKESHLWCFAHFSFQQYLTATDWREHPPAATDWAQFVLQPWWGETLVLFAAQSDASAILTACLDANTPKALALAFLVERMSKTLRPEVRERLKTQLHDALRSRDPAVFLPAAEAMLIVSQQNYISLDGKTAIAAAAISKAEFQLFLLDLADDAAFKRPPHWAETWFPGTPGEVVLGMRRHEAVEFCNWLNQEFPCWKHRLPTLEELSQVSSRSDLQPWYQPDPSGRCSPLPQPELQKQLEAFSKSTPFHDSAASGWHTALLQCLACVRDVADSHQFTLDLIYALDLVCIRSIDNSRVQIRVIILILFGLLIVVAKLFDGHFYFFLSLSLVVTILVACALALARRLENIGSETRRIEHAINLRSIVDRALDVALDVVLGHPFDLNLAQARAWDSACWLAITGTMNRNVPQQLHPERSHTQVDPGLITELTNRFNESPTAERPPVELILIQVRSAVSTTREEFIRHQRDFLKRALELIDAAKQPSRVARAPSRLWRVLTGGIRTKLPRQFPVNRQQLYAMLVVIQARERGELSAWEAIRVVREPA